MSLTTTNAQDRGEFTSASSAQADKNCPGRFLAQKGIPDESSRDADFGNAIHAALARGDSTGLDVTQESIYDSFKAIEDKLVREFFFVELPAAHLTVEKRYWVNFDNGTTTYRHSGQLDRMWRLGTKALILECKSLAGEVAESPENLQLRDQVCLYAAGTTALNTVAVAVIQPLVTHSPKLCVYQKADIERATREMFARIIQSNDPASPRVAGELQCKFCKARGKCPEYQRFAGSLVPMPRSLVDVPVAQWTPAERTEFCDSFDIAQKWLDNCWSAMEKGAREDPNFVPGWHLVDGSPREKIINLQAVYERATAYRVPLNDFLGRSSISKKDLAELIRLHGKLKGKALEAAKDEIIGDDVAVSDVKASLKKI